MNQTKGVNMKYLMILSLLTACGPMYTVQHGHDGSDGKDGHSTLISIIDANTCSNGGKTIISYKDMDDSGTLNLDKDTNVQTMQVCNGNNGSNGTDGATGAKGDKGDKGNDGTSSSFTPVDYVQPCGPTVAYKEVLLILFDGSLLGSFSDNASGLNTRFAFIPDGSYIDTDGSNCHFVVTHTAHTRTVTWSGGSKTWSF
jgi:hypothetical protein